MVRQVIKPHRRTGVTWLIGLMGFMLGAAPASLGPGAIGTSPFFVAILSFFWLMKYQGSSIMKETEKGPLIVLLLSTSLLTVGFLGATILNQPADLSETWIVTGQYMFSLFVFPLFCVVVARINSAAALRGYAIGFMCLILTAIVIYFGFYDWGRALGWIRSNSRLELWLGPNTLAIHIIIGIFVSWEWLKSVQSPTAYRVFLLAAALLTLFLTGSIGGVLIAAAGLFVRLLLTHPLKAVVIVPIIGTIGLLTLGALVENSNLQVLQRMSWVFGGDLSDAGSYSERLDLNSIALQMLEEQPAAGIGAGKAKQYFPTLVHNAILLVWLEGGIVAALGLLLAPLAFIMWAITTDKHLKGTAIALVFMIFLYWLTRTHAYQIYLYGPLALLLSGFTTKLQGCMHRKEQPSHQTDPQIQPA